MTLRKINPKQFTGYLQDKIFQDNVAGYFIYRGLYLRGNTTLDFFEIIFFIN